MTALLLTDEQLFSNCSKASNQTYLLGGETSAAV